VQALGRDPLIRPEHVEGRQEERVVGRLSPPGLQVRLEFVERAWAGSEDIGGDGDVVDPGVWEEGGHQEAGHVEVLRRVGLVGVEHGLVVSKETGIGGAPQIDVLLVFGWVG
jgi:hypothetical protein